MRRRKSDDIDQFDAHLIDHIGALAAQEVQAGLDGGVRLGVDLLKRQGLQLVLHLLHADAFGERGVNFHRFAGDAFAPRLVAHEMQGAHVVQAIGQLDQQHADVAAHRQHQLAEILRLLGAVGLQFQPGQLGDAIDEAGDFLAEPRLDFRQLDRRVLDHVMQQAGGDGGGIEPVARQDVGDGDGMGKYGSPLSRRCVPCACMAMT